ncbi:MAG: hypothetical protein Q8Q81_02670 [Oxalobacteraceae bacterium]|nr:hypothetical protein [Oxalobacteraceae bacterium]
MQRILSFDQTPPLSVPLRFFLTAPAFAIVASLLILWYGPQALESRWSPLTLALTHLLVLGFLAASMIGALVQILPVVAGVDLPRAQLTAGTVHFLLAVGTAALAAAFLLSQPLLFKLALLCLGSAFLLLLGSSIIGLWRIPDASATLWAIRLALIALLVTAVLGALLASAFAWSFGLPLIELTNLHARWGLLGWVGLLVIGVAYQVVPMFQVTPLYPPYLTRRLVPVLFLLLLLWSAVDALTRQQPNGWNTAMSIFVALGFMLFGLTTLYLLWFRKRPKPDVTVMFWRTGMMSLIACAALWITGRLLPQITVAPSYALFLGVLFIVGFAYSVINGMLYKIVPFLVWYHLQSAITQRGIVPNVKQVLPDSVTTRQFFAHLTALIILLAAVQWPGVVTHVAGFSFAVSSCWLLVNLIGATRMYRRIKLHAAHALATQ